MVISSRTPEGFPSRCPVCGAEANLEFSLTTGDAPCPRCGHLLWRSSRLFTTIQERIANALGVAPEAITPETPLAELSLNSLQTVEFIMEFEEELGFTLAADPALTEAETLSDLIRRLLDLQSENEMDGA